MEKLMGDEVKVVESSMVTPSGETPRKGLWVSALDLMLVNNGHTPIVYLYRSDSGAVHDGFFGVARLKVAMANALVAFYPLAGRLSMDADGRPEIDCADQGALFVVAHSDLTVDDISKFGPSPELRSLFVPRVEDYTPALMCGIQVNFLKCGGVALGTALHHVAIDAVSAFHFMQTWCAFSRGDGDVAGLELPCHDRTLLCARSPPTVHPDALTVMYPKLSPSELSVAVVNKIFVISKDQVAALKRACTGGGSAGTGSTFCALSAHVWRCLCAARRLPLDATTRLTLPANIRRSMRPPLPASYFGNGIIVLGAAGKVRDIIDQPLPSVACRIRDVIRRMDDELVRSAIDYTEMAGSLPALHADNMPVTDLSVVSWLGMPVYDADFGWGKPLVMHRAVQLRAGVVYLMDDDGGSVRILMSMEPQILNDLEHLLYANL
jgi:shikimate O-hydroxycinnamoyltransferase